MVAIWWQFGGNSSKNASKNTPWWQP